MAASDFFFLVRAAGRVLVAAVFASSFVETAAADFFFLVRAAVVGELTASAVGTSTAPDLFFLVRAAAVGASTAGRMSITTVRFPGQGFLQLSLRETLV